MRMLGGKEIDHEALYLTLGNSSRDVPWLLTRVHFVLGFSSDSTYSLSAATGPCHVQSFQLLHSVFVELPHAGREHQKEGCLFSLLLITNLHILHFLYGASCLNSIPVVLLVCCQSLEERWKDTLYLQIELTHCHWSNLWSYCTTEPLHK